MLLVLVGCAGDEGLGLVDGRGDHCPYSAHFTLSNLIQTPPSTKGNAEFFLANSSNAAFARSARSPEVPALGLPLISKTY
jgi:hypothetical protein